MTRIVSTLLLRSGRPGVRFKCHIHRSVVTQSSVHLSLTPVFAFLLLTFGVPLLSADVLLIEEVHQSERMNLPVNGQSKTAVQAQFGTPDHKHAAVGKPPISQWDYAQYSVYFEYDLVLFSVLHPGVVIETQGSTSQGSDSNATYITHSQGSDSNATHIRQ